VFTAFIKAFEQLSDPKIQRLLLISAGITLAIYAVLWGGLAWVMFSTEILKEMPFWDTVIDWFAVILAPVTALILFPVVISSLMGIFLDQVVDAVEAKHYPGMPPSRGQGLREIVFSSLRLLVLALVLNLILLPFYLLLPLVGQVGFYVINGYLIGREYLEMVALRQLTPPETTRLRAAYQGKFVMAGVLTTVLLTIPFVNLIAPIIGVAAMTHIVHALPNQPLRAGTLEVSS
jgi:uncharacterized protein involved in cysteine biosynthesis